MSGPVTLPAFWSVSEQDGTQTYYDADDPIAAGIYLVGRTLEDDPESNTVVLRAEFAIDGADRLDVDDVAVVRALADALNRAVRAHAGRPQ